MVNVEPEKRGDLQCFLKILELESIFESIEKFKKKIEDKITLEIFLRKYKKLLKDNKNNKLDHTLDEEIKILIELEKEYYIN